MIAVRCPECKARLKVDEAKAPPHIRCPKCGHMATLDEMKQAEEPAIVEAELDEDVEETPRPRKKKKRKIAQDSWLDNQFANTPVLLLVVFPFCCGGPALILGILGLALCQNPDAKNRALI